MTTSLFLALILTAGTAEAQQTARPAAPPAASQVDARFASWLGCWRLEDDLAGTGARMCITPEQTGVRLQTIVGVQRGIDERVIPDGVARPISDSECKGTERAEWSKDGLRVFRTTDVTCNNETPRTIKGVAFLAAGPSWINVQHVSGGAASTSVRVQRYRRAANQNLADGTRAPQPSVSASALPTAADVAWNIDDVIEASQKLPAEALQAALSDVRHGFNLNKHTLVALDEAGVPDGVIDLMVALTFPKRFVVERAGGGGGGAPIGISTGGGWFDPFMSPFQYGDYANCYTPMGYGYRSYYSMCGGYYSAYGISPYYSNYYGYPNTGWVVVDGPTGSISNLGDPSVEGRVVNGRGYTQVRPRNPDPAPSRVSGRGDGSAAGYSGASSGSSSGGSSGVSSQGYSGSSSGSSSGDSGRTAVARPPGGGY